MKLPLIIFVAAAIVYGCQAPLESRLPGDDAGVARQTDSTVTDAETGSEVYANELSVVGQDEPTETAPPEQYESAETSPPEQDETAETTPPERDETAETSPPEREQQARHTIEPAVNAPVIVPQQAEGPVMEDDESAFVLNDYSALSNATKGWYFNRNGDHTPPTAQRELDLSLFDAYYLGDTNEKVLYLTFDEGYENGFTAPILDTMKEKQVTAAFFLTKPYIKSEPELVRRMVDEGHVAANHSVSHKSFPSLSDEEAEFELNETSRYFAEITGAELPRFFRPPMGEYSERTLAIASDLGYKTLFWSFAYKDWLTDQQPGKDAALKAIMDGLHPGAILLLHAVSESNAQALPDFIDAARELGYTFRSLDQLPGR